LAQPLPFIGNWGQGSWRSTYEACLAYELVDRGLAVERQKELPVVYRGIRIECGYRIDLLVEGQVILELKAVEHLDAIHHAQVISYLKPSNRHVGLLINFNVTQLIKGLNRIVRDLPE
jgi:GxxExxY protein